MINNQIIAMWSGPRNLSTALMRSFGNRKDVISVLDEPFYASYLVSTKKNHPMKNEVISSQFNEIKDVKILCQKKNTGITYQKHMTQHIIDKDYTWMNNLTNCFLIRNPQMVVKSFMKSWNSGDFEDIGFEQQFHIYEYVKNNLNSHPPILDASKLRSNPKRVLSEFCKVIGIDWDYDMLNWSPGIKSYDGIWAKHWYPSVMKSTNFKPETSKKIKLTDNEKSIVDKAMPIYEELYKYSI
tara:strand:- start:4120 stop:4839 length:720 start_codon:yes stop_codon:yes gene_type:complete